MELLLIRPELVLVAALGLVVIALAALAQSPRVRVVPVPPFLPEPGPTPRPGPETAPIAPSREAVAAVVREVLAQQLEETFSAEVTRGALLSEMRQTLDERLKVLARFMENEMIPRAIARSGRVAEAESMIAAG